MNADLRRSLLPGLGAVVWLVAMLWIGAPIATERVATDRNDGFRLPDVCAASDAGAVAGPTPVTPPPAAPAGATAAGDEGPRASDRHRAALDAWKRVADSYLDAIGGSPLPPPVVTRNGGVEQSTAPASWSPLLTRDDGDVRRGKVTIALVAMAVVAIAGIAFGLRRTWAALAEDRSSPARFWVSLAVVAGTYLLAFLAPPGMPMLRAQPGVRDLWRESAFDAPPRPAPAAPGGASGACVESPAPTVFRAPERFANAAREGRLFFSLVAAENPDLAQAVETSSRHVLALAYACAIALVGAYAATLRRPVKTVADADDRMRDMRSILLFAAVIFLVGMGGHQAVRAWALGFLDADRAFLAPALVARMNADLLGIAIAYSLFMAVTYYPGAFALLEVRAGLAREALALDRTAQVPPAHDVLGILGRLVTVLAPVLGGVAADVLGKVLSG